MGTLTIIYPKSYQQGVEHIVDIVQHWKPKNCGQTNQTTHSGRYIHGA